MVIIQKTLSRFGSVLLSLVLVLSCMVPMASADYSSVGDAYRTANMWDWLMMIGNKVGSCTDYAAIVRVVTGISSSKVCGMSLDAYHHAHTIGHVGGVDENGSWYTLCTCYYCGETFRVYASDFEYSYIETNQVMGEDLGTTVISSDNTLSWSPVHDYTLVYADSAKTTGVYCRHHTASGSAPFSVTFNCSDYENGAKVTPSSGLASFTCYGVRFSYIGTAPVTGSYMLSYTPQYEFTVNRPDRLPYTDGAYWGKAGNYNAPTTQRTAGEEFTTSGTFAPVSMFEFTDIDIMGYAPVYKITPNNYDTLLANYGTNSRPGNVPGKYGILGNNSELIPVDTEYIVNESAKTVTNPVLGKVSKVSSWDYDYLTRTYSLTYTGGATASVTYGNEAVTIQEGGSAYTVYYLVPGSGFPPEAHVHSWTATVTNAATCTAPGSVSYSCSGCEETKTVDTLGHDWQVKETQEGYTLYECSRCQETKEEGTRLSAVLLPVLLLLPPCGPGLCR